ncbi:MAG: hypothetical protein WCO84_09255 [bacterium]
MGVKINYNRLKNVNIVKNIDFHEISITLVYVVCPREFNILEVSVLTMSEYDCIKDIVILHSGYKKPLKYGSLSQKCKKVKEFYKNFGEGCDVPIKDGGWSEVEARNFSLDLSYDLKNEWILLCDADEFFLLENLDFGKLNLYNSVRFSTYHFFEFDKYWEKQIYKHVIRGIELHDPHIRMFRKSLNAKFDYSYPSRELKNISNDCHPTIGDSSSCLLSDDLIHIHTNAIWKKKVPKYSIEDVKISSQKNIFNKHYKRLFELFEQNSLFC